MLATNPSSLVVARRVRAPGRTGYEVVSFQTGITHWPLDAAKDSSTIKSDSGISIFGSNLTSLWENWV